jgi:hypothetical protein
MHALLAEILCEKHLAAEQDRIFQQKALPRNVAEKKK